MGHAQFCKIYSASRDDIMIINYFGLTFTYARLATIICHVKFSSAEMRARATRRESEQKSNWAWAS